MPTLTLDALTAEAATAALAPHGMGLVEFAQALDEERRRFAPPAESGTRHLISTMGHMPDCPPTGLTYPNTMLIRPDARDVFDRPVDDRFLLNFPLMCAEMRSADDGILLITALLRDAPGGLKFDTIAGRDRQAGLDTTGVRTRVAVTLDHAVGVAAFHIVTRLPETALDAATGRPLSNVVDLPGCAGLVVTGHRRLDTKGAHKPLGTLSKEGCLVIETTLPANVQVAFEPVYRG